MSKRRLSLLVAGVGGALALALPGAASAAIPAVFDGAVSCAVQSDGDRMCGSDSPRSTVKSFDGVPIDVNVAFPPEPASGRDGGFPLLMLFHGYGGEKIGFASMERWLDQGYATFSMTDRGFHESCGTPASRAADPSGCERGYVRLIDNRYEVRDAQELAGMLADEGRIAPGRIGATGGSYGGGMSMALAALRDRKAMLNGALVPWTSPDGTPMRIAAAVPTITWTDLAYSLAPNGSALDYVAEAPYAGRFGVMKESLVNGLYVSGQLAPGFYAPEGSDPSADLTGWRDRLREGEPYDGDPQMQSIVDELTTNHSSYYIDGSRPPAPLLMANGWTDDLFPVDEIVRYYNRTTTEHPKADLSLFAAEIQGHPRSAERDEVLDELRRRTEQWFRFYLKDEGEAPFQGVRAYLSSCPSDGPVGDPIKARNWARLAPGEVVFGDRGGTIEPNAGDSAIAAPFNPVSGGGSCATTDAADQPGTVTVRYEPAPKGGLTLLGSPTVIADYDMRGSNSQVAARLLDVGPDGQQTLVARGLWRPTDDERQVFQMHPNGWTFEAGHVAKVELLPADADDGFAGPYGRPSDGQQAIGVADVEVRLPVANRPGSAPGVVAPRARILPEGYELAADFAALGDPRPKLAKGALKVNGGKLLARVKCPGRFDSCNDGFVVVRKAGKGAGFLVAAGSFEADGGETDRLSLKLTKRARGYFAKHRGMSTKTLVFSDESDPGEQQRRKARR